LVLYLVGYLSDMVCEKWLLKWNINDNVGWYYRSQHSTTEFVSVAKAQSSPAF